jgi:hypothetical protein
MAGVPAEKEVRELPRGRCDACRRKDVPLMQTEEGSCMQMDDDRASYAMIDIRWCTDTFDGPKNVCTDCLREYLESIARANT